MNFIKLLVGILLLGGCAVNDQYLALNPQINIISDDIGKGKTINLDVLDKRDGTSLGKITDAHKDSFNVELNKDFTKNLKASVGKALEKQSFLVGNSDIKMTVNIEKLALSSQKYPLTFKTDLEAIISVKIENGGERYGNRLRIIKTKRTAGPPFAKDSNELVNEAISNLLSDMLGSEKLRNVLTQ